MAKQNVLHRVGKPQHERGSRRAVGVDRAAAVQAVAGVARRRRRTRRSTAPSTHDGVGVEQEDVAPGARRGGPVHGAGEAEVAVRARMTRQPASSRTGSAASPGPGVVVDHEHLERRPRGSARGRSARTAGRARGAVPDDDDRHVESGTARGPGPWSGARPERSASEPPQHGTKRSGARSDRSVPLVGSTPGPGAPAGRVSAMPLRLCLFGASDDTGNLGVSALLRGTLAGIAERHPDAERHRVRPRRRGGRGRSPELGDRVVPTGGSGRRGPGGIHRPSPSPGWRSGRCPARRSTPAVAARARRRRRARARRGRQLRRPLRRAAGCARWPRRCAWRCALGRPLVLLPQTYGPVQRPTARGTSASVLVARSRRCRWARDRRRPRRRWSSWPARATTRPATGSASTWRTGCPPPPARTWSAATAPPDGTMGSRWRSTSAGSSPTRGGRPGDPPGGRPPCRARAARSPRPGRRTRPPASSLVPHVLGARRRVRRAGLPRPRRAARAPCGVPRPPVADPAWSRG